MIQKQSLPSEHLLALYDAEKKIKEKQRDYDQAQKDQQKLTTGTYKSNAVLVSKDFRARNSALEKMVRDFRESAHSLQELLDDYDRLMGMTEAYSIEEPREIRTLNENLLLKSQQYFWVLEAYVKKLHDQYQLLSSKPIKELTEDEVLLASELFESLGNELVAWGKVNYDLFSEGTDVFMRHQASKHYQTFGSAFEQK